MLSHTAVRMFSAKELAGVLRISVGARSVPASRANPFYSKLADRENAWARQTHEGLPDPKGNTIAIAAALLDSYAEFLTQAYSVKRLSSLPEKGARTEVPDDANLMLKEATP